MSRVELAKIPALTFYQDSLTKGRRSSPIQQLTCVGKPCKFYTPDVVRCQNSGGHGTEVEWKCEADLPDILRLGRVEVSCEGWAGPGDPYVLKGSCGLEYRLVELPGSLRDPGSDRSKSGMKDSDVASSIFTVIWVTILLLICYSFLRSCFSGAGTPRAPQTPGYRPGGGGGYGSFPGGPTPYDDHSTGPPPPYSKNPAGAAAGDEWRPGFWTGAALAGAGGYLWNQRNNNNEPRARRQWDWEDVRRPTGAGSSSWGGWGGRHAPSSPEDRGEGSSNLGAMRRSTGYGGSNVR